MESGAEKERGMMNHGGEMKDAAGQEARVGPKTLLWAPDVPANSSQF